MKKSNPILRAPSKSESLNFYWKKTNNVRENMTLMNVNIEKVRQREIESERGGDGKGGIFIDLMGRF